MLNYSVSEENYIKAIYHLQTGDATVTTNALAQELHTRPASVTDMMKKLKAKKLLHYQPYQGFRLSTEGSKVALGIIRRHRLIETWLVREFGYAWDEVHDEAEILEHAVSDMMLDRIDAKLGQRFPGLSRGIQLVEWRYNQHLHPRALLIEVGCQENSKEEAIRSIELFGDTVAEILAES